LWQIATGKELPKLEESERQSSVAFTPDGTRLMTGGSSKISVWDVRKQQRIYALPLEGHGHGECLAPSFDSKYVAVTSSSGRELQIFRLPSVPR